MFARLLKNVTEFAIKIDTQFHSIAAGFTADSMLEAIQITYADWNQKWRFEKRVLELFDKFYDEQ